MTARTAIRLGLAALALTATAPLLTAAPAFAHGSLKPQHGGMVQMSGEIMVELVKAPKGIDVYVSEEDEPVAANRFDAKMSVTIGSAKSDAVLKPQAGNKFSAPGVKAPKGTKIVVTLVDKGDRARTFATFLVK